MLGLGFDRRRVSVTLAAVAALLAGGALYCLPPPSEISFYPQCPFHQFTGLLCPGCGSTRALYALLHGHLQQAIHWNGLLVLVVLPMMAIYLLAALRSGRWPRVSPPAIAVALVVTVSFTLLRNLPYGVL